MENALEADAKNISVTFYRKGSEGFDFKHDEQGIPELELTQYCKTIELRCRNELYKTRSIGFRGEALNSMSKTSNLVIFTKEKDDSQCWKVHYKGDGMVSSIEKSDLL